MIWLQLFLSVSLSHLGASFGSRCFSRLLSYLVVLLVHLFCLFRVAICLFFVWCFCWSSVFLLVSSAIPFCRIMCTFCCYVMVSLLAFGVSVGCYSSVQVSGFQYLVQFHLMLKRVGGVALISNCSRDCGTCVL